MKTILHATALSLWFACGLFAWDIPTAEAVKSVTIEFDPQEHENDLHFNCRQEDWREIPKPAEWEKLGIKTLQEKGGAR